MPVVEIQSPAQLSGLISEAKVTVVKFYATWCGPCQTIAPHYERLSTQYEASQVSFCSCNSDANRSICQQYEVSALPTFLIFVSGNLESRVRGGDLGQVVQTIDRLLRFLPPASSGSSQRNGNTKIHHQMMHDFLLLKDAVESQDEVARKDACDRLYAQLETSSKPPLELPLGMALAPCLATEDQGVAVALNAFLQHIESKPLPKCHEAGIIVNELLRMLKDGFLASTWFDPASTKYKQVLLILTLSAVARKHMATSPFFFTSALKYGDQVETDTVLGAMLGLSPFQRTFQWPIMGSLFELRIRQMIDYFPREEADGNGEGGAAAAAAAAPGSGRGQKSNKDKVKEIQTALETADALNNTIFRHLMLSKEAREVTLKFLGTALNLNSDYTKTMLHRSRIASLYFMTQLNNVLMEFGMGLFTRAFDPSTIPAYYFLKDAQKDSMWPLPDDLERVTHFDDANPLPKLPENAEVPFKPKVHLFFLSILSLRLNSVVLIDTMYSHMRQHNQPGLSDADRQYYNAEKYQLQGLLGSQMLSTKRVRLLNGVAKWLLSVMKVDAMGVLPSVPPTEWQYLPQDLIYCVIRGIQAAPLESYSLDSTLSLMLVLMGNLTYFPKPHSHATFSSVLVKLRSQYDTNQVLENHPWFVSHIVRACINCYIAVEKSTYERVQVRYELSSCIENLLKHNSLCDPIRKEFETEGTVLERFSHMVAAEVNDAVDQVLENLTKMNAIMKEGGDLTEEAAARRRARQQAERANAANPGNAANPNANRSRNNNNDENDEEEEEEAAPDSSEATYHERGRWLENYIELFNASVNMFIQLAIQFPVGVAQNMVAQQIAQMLARSLVAFAGPDSKNLKIENAEKYQFRPREILGSIVNCLTQFSTSKNFLRRLCECGTPVDSIIATMQKIVSRQLVTESSAINLAHMAKSLEATSKAVGAEASLWEDAPDFALDALLSTPLVDPVAIPAEVKDLDDLIYVNHDTLHHHLLSESKNPFTKEYLDEAMLTEFNARPDVAKAREELVKKIADWLEEEKAKLNA